MKSLSDEGENEDFSRNLSKMPFKRWKWDFRFDQRSTGLIQFIIQIYRLANRWWHLTCVISARELLQRILSLPKFDISNRGEAEKIKCKKKLKTNRRRVKLCFNFQTSSRDSCGGIRKVDTNSLSNSSFFGFCWISKKLKTFQHSLLVDLILFL